MNKYKIEKFKFGILFLVKRSVKATTLTFHTDYLIRMQISIRNKRILYKNKKKNSNVTVSVRLMVLREFMYSR